MTFGCVILSKDSDVTIILALAQSLYGKGLRHILDEKVIEIDSLIDNLPSSNICASTLSCAYVLARCDFSAGTYEVTYENYFRAVCRQISSLGALSAASDPNTFALITLLAYLEKGELRYW